MAEVSIPYRHTLGTQSQHTGVHNLSVHSTQTPLDALMYWRGGGRGGARVGESVLEGWGEGSRKEGRVEERGEVACSYIPPHVQGESIC